MSDTKFTPGPWRSPMFHGSDETIAEARAFGLTPIPALDNDGSRFLMADGKRIGLIDCQTKHKRGQGHKTECAERDANAHLIAAAPELYAALTNMCEVWAAICRATGWEPSRVVQYDDGIAALKKARGEA